MILTVNLILYSLKMVGAGDVKYILTFILFLGGKEVLKGLLISVVVQACFFLIFKRRKMPFSPALTIGLLAVSL